MRSAENHISTSDGREWDLSDSPAVSYYLGEEQYFEGGPDHPFGAAEGEPVEQYAEMVKTAYLATEKRPLGAHAEPSRFGEYIASTDQPPFTARSLANDEYEFLSWITVFTPPVVETYGRETLLSAPAWKVEELEDGGILVVAYGDPHADQYDAGTARYVAVADHIGLSKYFEYNGLESDFDFE